MVGELTIIWGPGTKQNHRSTTRLRIYIAGEENIKREGGPPNLLIFTEKNILDPKPWPHPLSKIFHQMLKPWKAFGYLKSPEYRTTQLKPEPRWLWWWASGDEPRFSLVIPGPCIWVEEPGHRGLGGSWVLGGGRGRVGPWRGANGWFGRRIDDPVPRLAGICRGSRSWVFGSACDGRPPWNVCRCNDVVSLAAAVVELVN